MAPVFEGCRADLTCPTPTNPSDGGGAGRAVAGRLCFGSQLLGLSRLGWEKGPDAGLGWGESAGLEAEDAGLDPDSAP